MPENHVDPHEGGSYTRDPVTGALQLVERTAPALPRGVQPSSEAEAEAQPQAAAQPAPQPDSEA